MFILIYSSELCDPDDNMDSLKPKVDPEKLKAANLRMSGTDEDSEGHYDDEADNEFADSQGSDNDFDFDGDENVQKDEL